MPISRAKNPSRVTVINPLYLQILKKIRNNKIPGSCANPHCGHRFIFKSAFILKKMIPHIKECKKREEKRGSYKWIAHTCKKCKRHFVWEFRIFLKINGNSVMYRYDLATMKGLGNWRDGKKNTKAPKKSENIEIKKRIVT